MKKFLVSCVLILSISILIFVFTACKDTKPPTPTEESKVISTPSDVSISDGVANWSPVKNADGYKVEISDEGGNTKSELIERNTYILDYESKVFFKVKAVAKKGFKDSAFSKAVEVSKIAEPTNIRVTGDILSWDAVADASGYTVSIGERSLYAVSVNSFDLSTADTDNFKTIKVLARGGTNKIGSNYVGYFGRTPVVLGKLNLTLSSTAKGGKLGWNSLPNALGYTLFLEGKAPIDLALQTEYEFSQDILSTPKNYTYTLKAKSGSAEFVSATFSDTILVETPPTVSVKEGKLHFTNLGVADGLVLTVYQKDTDKVIDNIHCGATDYYNGANLASGEWSISVRKNLSLAKKLLGSISSPKINTTRLESPSVTFHEGRASWNKVSKAAFYIGIIKKADGSIERKSSIPNFGSEISLNFSGLSLPSGTFTFQIECVADGNDLSSVPSQPISFECLSSPNTKIKDKTIVWDALPNDENIEYFASFNGSSYGTAIKTKTPDGKYFLDISSENYMRAGNNRVAIIAKPTSVAASNLIPSRDAVCNYYVLESPILSVTREGILMWNAAAFATGYDIEISPNKDNILVSTTKNSYFLEGFVDGDYSVKIIAKGNGTDVFASKRSAVFEVTKLQTPDNINIIGSTIEWQAVSGVSAYEIEVRGSSRITETNGFGIVEFESAFGKLDNMEFKVRAIALSSQAGNKIVSDWATYQRTGETDLFFAGEGTSEKPFIIYNFSHLNNIRLYPDRNFLLINNIFCNNVSWFATDFGGNLNGAGYTISNYETHIDDGYAGLFKTIKNGAVVEGVKFDSVTVYADAAKDAQIGVLAGKIEKAKIYNCSISQSNLVLGNVDGGSVGLLAGYSIGNITATKISTSKIMLSDGNVELDESTGKKLYIGGMVGYLDAPISEAELSSITISLSSKRIKQSIVAGGAVGHISDTTRNKIERVFIGGEASCLQANLEVDSFDFGGVVGTSQGDVLQVSSNMKVDINLLARYARIGGLGASVRGSIERAIYQGNINVTLLNASTESKISIAGFVAETSAAIIKNSFVLGAVTYKNIANLAGSDGIFVAGFAKRAIGGAISNCYSDVAFSLPANFLDTNIASFITENEDTITACFYNSDKSGYRAVGSSGEVSGAYDGIRGLSNNNMSKPTSFFGWNVGGIDSVWEMDNATSRPTLKR